MFLQVCLQVFWLSYFEISVTLQWSAVDIMYTENHGEYIPSYKNCLDVAPVINEHSKNIPYIFFI
jgi:hypothetical protein